MTPKPDGLITFNENLYIANEKLFGNDFLRYYRCDLKYPYCPEEFPFMSVDKADDNGDYWCRSWMRKDGPTNLGKGFTHEQALGWALEKQNG